MSNLDLVAKDPLFYRLDQVLKERAYLETLNEDFLAANYNLAL